MLWKKSILFFAIAIYFFPLTVLAASFTTEKQNQADKVSDIEASKKYSAECAKIGCAEPASQNCSAPLKDDSGSYFCLNISCANGDSCKVIEKACSKDEDCEGYALKGGEKCFKNHCYLDAVGQEKFNKTVSLGLTDLKADLQIKKPLLNIKIPGLNFSDLAKETITEEGGKTYLNIPYIGEYLSVAYKVGLVLISIVGVVMIIITGIKIIVGGGEGKAEGFKRIGQIMVGLLIGWGSYTMLSIVNPDLVSFKALRVQYIEPIPTPVIDFGDDTLTDADNADPKSPYEFKYFKEDKCPIELTNKEFYKEGKEGTSSAGSILNNIPRRLEFHQKVMADPKLISGSIGERIQRAVELTARCKIHYENCGVATTNMYALAAQRGSKSDNCLLNVDPGKKFGKSKTSYGFCNFLGNDFGNIKKQTIHDAFGFKTPYGSVSTLIRGLWCGSVNKCGGDIGWKELCFQNQTDAANKLKSILQSTGKWSPDWVDDMQPGDYYIVVNWNSSCNAAHSAMFMGWADKASRAAYTEKGDAFKFLRVGSLQFGGDEVVLGIYRPK